MPRKLKWTIALHLAWFPALFVAWAAIAGEAGSPAPDNWAALERILDILGVSALLSLLLLALAPAAWFDTSTGARWARTYAILLLLACVGTVALCLAALTFPPTRPAVVTAPSQAHAVRGAAALSNVVHARGERPGPVR